MTAKPLTPKEDVDRLCLKIATEAPRAHLEAATTLRALLAERDAALYQLELAEFWMAGSGELAAFKNHIASLQTKDKPND